jgi:hypothetical protein
MNGDKEMLSAANDLRTTISNLLEVRHSDRIILAPGILVALRILFAHLGIHRILLTDEEYYGVEHFPGASIQIASCGAMLDGRLSRGFDAVIASPASWRGTRQPVAELFRSIRKTTDGEAPLLIADYAHAGSIGFPSVNRLHADVVCGDLEKWILPPHLNSRVAFLWFRTRRSYLRAEKAFRSFFLATNTPHDSMLARWIDPADVSSISRALKSPSVTPDQLRARHRRDMNLAREIAIGAERVQDPETSILWFQDNELDEQTTRKFEQLGLAWQLPGRGTRVLCRSDVAPASRPQRNPNSA